MFRVETDCSLCDVQARWRLLVNDERRTHWEREGGNSFPCPHWEQHHDVLAALLEVGRKRATVPPVDGRVLRAAS